MRYFGSCSGHSVGCWCSRMGLVVMQHNGCLARVSCIAIHGCGGDAHKDVCLIVRFRQWTGHCSKQALLASRCAFAGRTADAACSTALQHIGCQCSVARGVAVKFCWQGELGASEAKVAGVGDMCTRLCTKTGQLDRGSKVARVMVVCEMSRFWSTLAKTLVAIESGVRVWLVAHAACSWICTASASRKSTIPAGFASLVMHHWHSSKQCAALQSQCHRRCQLVVRTGHDPRYCGVPVVAYRRCKVARRIEHESAEFVV